MKTQPFSKKDPEEIDDTVQAFLNLRPDGFALNVKKQEIAILEFTRAMDTDVQWEVRKDAEKRRRYAPVLDFFSASRKCASWKLSQINFTVGVRGSISTADILESGTMDPLLRLLSRASGRLPQVGYRKDPQGGGQTYL